MLWLTQLSKASEFAKFSAVVIFGTYACAWLLGPWGIAFLDQAEHGLYSSRWARSQLLNFHQFSRLTLILGLAFAGLAWFRSRLQTHA